jgi:NAD(P)-dependent dehydrogenase (short-subunit alcohol dehydrogenase family)
MTAGRFDLTGKAAIVTGGGKGLGLAISMGLAEAGMDVLVCARELAPLKEAAQEIREKGVKAAAVSMDVRDQEQVASMVETAVSEFGRIDLLVNNAGASFHCPVEEISSNGWSAVVDINLKGVFLCSREVGKVMKEQGGGVIVNITSIAGRDGSPYMAPYGAAKAGVINFTRTLAMEWARHNIRVNALGPGPFMTEGAADTLWQKPELKERRLSSVPMKRFGEPDEIVGAVIFLASGASSFMSGDTIYVDGGPPLRAGGYSE